MVKKDVKKNLGNIKTLDLGIKKKLSSINKKAKTHKGRKILESKEAKVVENTKTAIFLRGNKISSTISSLISELHILRGTAEASRLFMRKA